MLERLQRLARLDSELVDEQAARLSVERERVGLPARTVEGNHQLSPRPLLEGLLTHDRLELRDELPRPTESELRIDPIGDDLRPQLSESTAFLSDETLSRQIR